MEARASAEDVRQTSLFLGDSDLPRDAAARRHPGLCEVGVRGSTDEQVRPGDDPRRDLEDFELELVRHDRLQAEWTDHAAEQGDRSLHGPLAHLERLRQERLPQHDRHVASHDERWEEAHLAQCLLGPELVHLVDIRLVPSVHSEHLEAPFRERVARRREWRVEVVDVIPRPDDILLDREFHPGLDRLPEVLVVLRDEGTAATLGPVVLHEHGAIDVFRVLDLQRHRDPADVNHSRCLSRSDSHRRTSRFPNVGMGSFANTSAPMYSTNEPWGTVTACRATKSSAWSRMSAYESTIKNSSGLARGNAS